VTPEIVARDRITC